MASGLPVVSTPTVRAAEVVADGGTGRLVPLADPPAVADAFEALLADGALRDHSGAAGRPRVEAEYRRDRRTGRLTAALSDCLRDAAGAPRHIHATA